MLDFAREIPVSAGLEWVKDWDFLYHFEAERLLTMREVLLESGFKADSEFRVLDFGYLHGLVPEFLHRFFPRSRFIVLDHPDSPNFRNAEYLKLIHQRDYLRMEPCDIADVDKRADQFDLIILGEIIEHLDPTLVAKAATHLRKRVTESGRLLITTPNGAGIRNTADTFLGRDAQCPPLPIAEMQYGHIHLWTPELLRRTLKLLGWEHDMTRFVHGFERWEFQKTNRHWGSLRHQVYLKSLYWAASLRPQWRGFTVSAWRPLTQQAGR